MSDNGSIIFDNAVQRGLVWDIKRKSLLIDSMIQGYPIPPFYARRGENRIFDMLDGKQRCHAIKEYLKNEYALEGVAEEYEGKYFNDLDEDIQDEIKNYSLTLYYFEDITDEQVNELFYRINNGKPLTAIELTRVKAKSFDVIKGLAAHPIFTDALKDNQINKYVNEDIVIKALVMLNCNKPSLENKYIRPWVIETEITDAMAADVQNALARLQYTHMALTAAGHVKAAKKLFTRTHLISLVPLALKSVKEGVDCDWFAGFINWFFTPAKGVRGVSISTVYNAHSLSGSNSVGAVEYRVTELAAHYKKYMEG